MLRTAFASYLKHLKRASENTQQAYLRDLDQLGAFLQEKHSTPLFDEASVKDITHRMLRTWISALREHDCTPRTVARKMSAVRTYFKYLKSEGKVAANPASRLHIQQKGRSLPVFLQEAETQTLFTEIEETDDGSFAHARNQALIELLYGCGLRRAEVIGLKASQVDLAANQVSVLGKGNKQRIVPFGKKVHDSLQHYLRVANEKAIPVETHFFVLENGLPLYPNLVYRVVNKYLGQVSSLKKRSPHVLRHTFATHLLDHGADLNAIKELLGHAGLAATQVYTHNSIAKLKSVHEKAHPRAEQKVNRDKL